MYPQNTVKKYIREAGPPEFKAREYSKQLEKFREEIEAMLGKGYIGTRIHKELVKKGFNGSLSSVHRFLRDLKAQRKVTQLATTRVETGPGEQMQYDWKEWYLTVGGRKVKVYIHEVVLSLGRLKYYTFSLTITCADVIRALCEAVIFFGGCAAQLVLDNAVKMVITHYKDGVIRYNEEFLKFCGLCGVEPLPCKTYRPRTKGKAERPFFYVQEYLLRGLEVNSLKEFETRLTELQDEYNQRPHSKLGRSPTPTAAVSIPCPCVTIKSALPAEEIPGPLCPGREIHCCLWQRRPGLFGGLEKLGRRQPLLAPVGNNALPGRVHRRARWKRP